MKQLYYSTVMKIIIYSSFEMMADIVCTRLLLLFVSRKRVWYKLCWMVYTWIRWFACDRTLRACKVIKEEGKHHVSFLNKEKQGRHEQHRISGMCECKVKDQNKVVTEIGLKLLLPKEAAIYIW